MNYNQTFATTTLMSPDFAITGYTTTLTSYGYFDILYLLLKFALGFAVIYLLLKRKWKRNR